MGRWQLYLLFFFLLQSCQVKEGSDKQILASYPDGKKRIEGEVSIVDAYLNRYKDNWNRAAADLLQAVPVPRDLGPVIEQIFKNRNQGSLRLYDFERTNFSQKQLNKGLNWLNNNLPNWEEISDLRKY